MDYTSNQSKPLAPAAYRISSDDPQSPARYSKPVKNLDQRKCMIQCCGCITAILLLLVVIFLILIFTIFHVKAPVIRIDSMKIDNFTIQNRSTLFSSGGNNNMTIVADGYLKNTNYGSFKFDHVVTVLYYFGTVIGESVTMHGVAKKRSTLRMNVTVDLIMDKLLAISGLSNDLKSGSLSFNSYTKINGRIKVVKTVNKLVVVNCTMDVNVTSQMIQGYNCVRHVSI